ncbi:MAG: hypothetical protein KDJ75_04680 [Alphaproteobacteria bacterium]|nr:hypothetical protein [Alphaproteobacteria bacterium]
MYKILSKLTSWFQGAASGSLVEEKPTHSRTEVEAVVVDKPRLAEFPKEFTVPVYIMDLQIEGRPAPVKSLLFQPMADESVMGLLEAGDTITAEFAGAHFFPGTPVSVLGTLRRGYADPEKKIAPGDVSVGWHSLDSRADTPTEEGRAGPV